MGAAYSHPFPPRLNDVDTVEGECKVVPEVPKMTFYTPEEQQKLFSLKIDEEEK